MVITTLVCGSSSFWLLFSVAAATTTTIVSVLQTITVAATNVLMSFSERRCELWDASEASEAVTTVFG